MFKARKVGHNDTFIPSVKLFKETLRRRHTDPWRTREIELNQRYQRLRIRGRVIQDSIFNIQDSGLYLCSEFCIAISL